MNSNLGEEDGIFQKTSEIDNRYYCRYIYCLDSRINDAANFIQIGN